MQVAAVVFDMDGTLLDSSETVPAAYAAAIYELCGRRCTDDEVIAEYGAGPAAALLSRFIGRPAPGSDVKCWLRHLEARLGSTSVYPGVPAMLAELRRRGVALAVFTGATRRAADLQLRHSGLAEFFEVVVGSDEIARVKPAPDGLRRIGELLGVAVASTAYVGDALNDLRCARNAGAIPIAAGWGHLFEADREPHICVPDPLQLVEMLLSDVGRTDPIDA